jgi:hypothetical protein
MCSGVQDLNIKLTWIKRRKKVDFLFKKLFTLIKKTVTLIAAIQKNLYRRTTYFGQISTQKLY